MKKIYVLALSALVAFASNAAKPLYKDSRQPVEKRVADLVGRMTTDEKIGQLLCPMGWEMYEVSADGRVGVSAKFLEMNGSNRQPGGYWAVLRADPWTQKTLDNGLSPRMAAEALNALQKEAVENTRLGIPLLFAEECAHGHMAIGSTVFPTGLSMAGTWNRALLELAGDAVAVETRTKGAHVGYGPVVDVARDPRWSRMEETFGEDPRLSGELGAAYMVGLQGNDPKSDTYIYSTLKHFAAYGIPDGGLNGAGAQVGAVKLYSDYLEPFRIVAEAGGKTIMTSYNSIDGVPSTGNKELIDGTLRGRWKFDGAVYSDLFSIDGMVSGEAVAADMAEAAALALKAGVDIDLGANAYRKGLGVALERGLVTEADLNRAVGHVLDLKFRMGLFENPYVDPAKAEASAQTASTRGLAREVARQGTALLKNDGMLPLSKSVKRIAVIGPNADNMYNQLGDYTAPQREEDVVTVLEGIRAAVGEGTEVEYVKGCAIRDTTKSDIAAAVAAANRADAVVLVVGGSSARDFRTKYEETGAAKSSEEADIVADMDCGEGFDRGTLRLLGDQQKLVESVLTTGVPTVVVYIGGRPLDMSSAAEQASAVMAAWYPGAEGGNAIADLIFGDANPSGRLPVTIPRGEWQLPIYYSQGQRRDYIDAAGSPLYAFGHGLSYTEFAYSDMRVLPGRGGDELGRVVCKVTNTGARDGAEVVQLYIRDMVGSVGQPVIALKDFKRVEIAKGYSVDVEFSLTADKLAMYDKQLRHVVEPGRFKVMVGASSADIRLNGELNVEKEVVLTD